MVKFIGNAIASPLSHIFNLSLNSGKFPSKLKQCRVIPIFKSGNVMECDNYRPISLLSSISKVLEKIVAEKLTNHLLSNNLLYQHQCAADFSLLNLPKGKSLGRSKPATNS